MVEIFSIDPGKRMGYAYRQDGVVKFGTRDFSAFVHDYAALGVRVEEWLARTFTELEPTVVAYETPFFNPKTPTAAKLLHGICWEIEKMGFKRDVTRIGKAPISIKKCITGDARADKEKVMQAVRDRGHKITTNHEADAVALLLMVENA